MKKLNFQLLAVIFAAFVLAFSACKKDDEEEIQEPPTPPTMTSIAIDGENTEFTATIEFSEGVYKSNNSTGNLDETSLIVSLTGGVAGLDSYTVDHTAGNNTAEINIVLVDYSDGNEEITVQPASATSIYNNAGTAMEESQSQKITLSGTTFETINISDDGNGTGTVTWTRNNTYVLNGFVFVNDGDVLIIEAGTVIKGKPGQGENASALIVARGGQIMAEGTDDMPIIFTAESDDLNGNLAVTDRGLWGGLIILGSAKLNSTPGETQIEGIPTNEERGRYGGDDDSDNSGIVKYVSIRHGGTDIGEGNEINGLTLGAVGSGTVIEYIEVIANKDDGVEFFGGKPQLKNILVAYVGDDSFDYDEGFRGKGQFWCAIQDPNEGDRLGEHDGGTDPETGEPYAIPTIYNASYIGRGEGAGKRVITFRDNAGGHYRNSIFSNQDKGIDIENLDDDQDSYKQFSDGNLTIENNVFWAVSDGTAEGLFKVSGPGASPADSLAAVQAFAAYFNDAGNSVTDPGVSIDNPVPSNPVTDNLAPYNDVWFDEVSYKGAFGSDNWAAGWTRYFSEK
ncbi:MAG: hypothetical protein K8R68_01625 [Bacteroidales bacterium]|nr:hypothetical protein [Bacteroidales bacterium]